MDAYILKIMGDYFVFIEKKRLRTYKRQGIPQPLRSKVIIVWGTIVLILAVTNVIMFHVLPFFEGDTTENRILGDIIFYMKYINYPIFQFVSVSTITYVIYFQVMETKREAAEMQRDIIAELKQDDMVADETEDTESHINSLTGIMNKMNLNSSRENLADPQLH